MTRDDAYMLSSVAGRTLDITELVDGNVGVHAKCPKNIFNCYRLTK
jgi:acetamidase/formamidase